MPSEAQYLAVLEAEEKSRAQAKVNYLKRRTEFEEDQALFSVKPEDYETSMTNWYKWVNAHDHPRSYLDDGRFCVPSVTFRWTQKDVRASTGEEDFSEVLEAGHEECLTCEAMRVMGQDARLTKEEKNTRIANFKAHKTPLLRLPPTENWDHDEALLRRRAEEMAERNDPAWNHSRVQPAPADPSPSIMETLKESLPNSAILEHRSGSGSEFTERSRYFDATRQLLQSTNDKAMLDAMMHDPDFLARAKVFRRNEQTVERAVNTTNLSNHLSAAERNFIARTTAEAWELERDLVRLESMKKALAVRRDWAAKGYSVNWWTGKQAVIRKENFPDYEGRPLRYGRLGLAKGVVGDDGDEREAREKEEEENDAAVEVTNSPFLEGKELSLDMLSESHEQLTPRGGTLQVPSGPSMFLNTLQNFHKHNLEAAQRVETKTSLVEDDPSKDVPASGKSKGKAKKDSKVEGLMEEDGINLEALAVKSDDKKPDEVQKIPVKDESSRPERPGWR